MEVLKIIIITIYILASYFLVLTTYMVLLAMNHNSNFYTKLFTFIAILLSPITLPITIFIILIINIKK